MFFLLNSHFDPRPHRADQPEDVDLDADPTTESDAESDSYGGIDEDADPVELCEYVEFTSGSETDLDIDDGLEQNIFPSAGNPIEPRYMDIAALVNEIERNERSPRVGGSYWDIVPGDDDRPLKPKRHAETTKSHAQLLAEALAKFDAEETEMIEAGSVSFPDDDSED